MSILTCSLLYLNFYAKFNLYNYVSLIVFANCVDCQTRNNNNRVSIIKGSALLTQVQHRLAILILYKGVCIITGSSHAAVGQYTWLTHITFLPEEQ